MINFLIKTIATGFYDEEIILKHEAGVRAWMNIMITGLSLTAAEILIRAL